MSDYMKMADFCEEAGIDRHSVWEFAKRDEDPMPLRYLPGRTRRGFFIVGELSEWLARNATFMNGRGPDEKHGKSDAA